MERQEVILVSEADTPVGIMEKMEAHQKGLLHRAFSIFIFNSKGEMLLQQRAISKYHSGGLWTNACCSHPQPGEDTLESAERRLQEEMGFKTPLRRIFDFVYRAEFDNGLIEHEFDHVFIGDYEQPVDFNKAEVMAYEYVNMEELAIAIEKNPGDYTAWFGLVFPRIRNWWKGRTASMLA